jgi:hypothetical protein
MESLKKEHKIGLDEVRQETERRHANENSRGKEQAKIEQEEWRERMILKHNAEKKDWESEMRVKLNQERDQEIEHIISKVTAEQSVFRKELEGQKSKGEAVIRKKFSEEARELRSREEETKELLQAERKQRQMLDETLKGLKDRMHALETEKREMKDSL